MLVVKVLFFVVLLPLSLLANDVCLKCHSEDTPAIEGKGQIIDLSEIEKSIHSDLSCEDCHIINPEEVHCDVSGVLCGNCHVEETKSYAMSPHMEGRSVSVDLVPGCSDCHGGHNITAVDAPESNTNHINSVQICINCHTDENIIEKFDILPEPQMIIAYENSIHGKELLEKGNMDAPSCVDCHGSHSFLPSDRPDSPLNKVQVVRTCSKCHPTIGSQYSESVHGQALSKGVTESPTCTDCHGEHDIKAHLDPESKVFISNIPKTCSDCHASTRIVGRFGLKAERIETFKESFHGVAVELGEKNAANCASCHGIHDIYPQDDPRSMIHKDKIAGTCGQCHEDLPEDFIQGDVHTSAEHRSSGGKFYVRKFYLWFVPILIFVFIIYRVLEYKRRSQKVEK